jgi:hypothetical protein
LNIAQLSIHQLGAVIDHSTGGDCCIPRKLKDLGKDPFSIFSHFSFSPLVSLALLSDKPSLFIGRLLPKEGPCCLGGDDFYGLGEFAGERERERQQ